MTGIVAEFVQTRAVTVHHPQNARRAILIHPLEDDILAIGKMLFPRALSPGRQVNRPSYLYTANNWK